MDSESSPPGVDEILKQSEPPIEDLLSCPDIITAYRNQQKDLISYLSQTKIMNKMVKILHRSDCTKLSRKVIDLFTSTNKTLLRQFSQKRKTTELLISIFNTNFSAAQQAVQMAPQLQSNGQSEAEQQSEIKTEELNKSVVTAVMQVCVYAFNDWEREMFAIFNSSQTIFPYILKHVEKPPVFSFLRSILTCTSQAQTFLWYFFVALMDEHGVGMDTPDFIQAEFALRTPNVHLTPEQRNTVINLLALFYQFGADDAYNEFTAALTQGLPLVLQDCNTDSERAAVFKLGLYLPNNPTICLSAVSILECFRVPAELLQAAIRYLTQCHYRISPDLAELLLYRLIRMNSSTTIIKETLPLFMEFSDSQMMQNTLLGIMNFVYEKITWRTNIQLRTIRLMLTNAICGRILDPLNADFPDIMAHFMEDPPEGFIDQNRMKLIRGKSSQAMPTHYNAVILWGTEAEKMAQIYPSLNKPNYLRILNPKKFEDVHFVSETKSTELITQDSTKPAKEKPTSSTATTTALVGCGFIDEFDTGEPVNNPFLVPPPPQSLQLSKKPSLILQTFIGPKAELFPSDPVVFEIQTIENKNRKTQTKTRNRCDACTSTATAECIIIPRTPPARKQKEPSSHAAYQTLKPARKKEYISVNQIQAPPLALPINLPIAPIHQTLAPGAGLMLAPKTTTQRRVSNEAPDSVDKSPWFDSKNMQIGSNGPNPFNQRNPPTLFATQQFRLSRGPATLADPKQMMEAKLLHQKPQQSTNKEPIQKQDSLQTQQSEQAKPQNEVKQDPPKPTIKNPYLELVNSLLTTETTPLPPMSFAGMNLDWIKFEMNRNERRASHVPTDT